MVRFSTCVLVPGRNRRLALPVAVWTFLFALLFGAIAPLGPPETLVHGAAFNPATTSVAITGKRSEQSVTLVGGLRESGFDGASGSGLPSFAPALDAVLVLFVLLFAREASLPLRPVECHAHRARAPPSHRHDALPRLRA
ncbi:hypothetical protein [Sphingomonas sp.]|uniref:hypothetical protein n=1 Tax=Sphingomonas sp. TaxID=28214 RepID=UPI002FD99E15